MFIFLVKKKKSSEQDILNRLVLQGRKSCIPVVA